MKRSCPMMLVAALLACASSGLAAGTNAPPVSPKGMPLKPGEKGHTGTKQSKYLYTKPDPTAAGGLRLHIATTPDQTLLGVYAIPQRELKICYQAELGQGGEVRFTGLPVAKYDLLVLFSDCYYEGFALCREKNTLTKAHIEDIDKTIQRSTPFFNLKRLDRCEGSAGEEGEAYAVQQDMRTKPVTLQSGEVRDNIQIRSLKLAWFADMGETGWHLRGTSEIKRQEVLVGPEVSGLLPHYYSAALQGIRVTDNVKDLGQLNLEKK